MSLTQSVRWTQRNLFIIDQTRLPQEAREIRLDTISDVVDAIKTLKVRGAPAIGITAAYGVLIGLFNSGKAIDEVDLLLRTSRPTAVNLMWALDRMKHVYADMKDKDPDTLYAALEQEAIAIHEADKLACETIGEHLNTLIPQGANILTVCNTGFLATGGIGTAFGGIVSAHRAEKDIHVWVTETRPLLQGARLTAWECLQWGIPTTLITDNMAAMLMQQGRVDCVIAGADRIAVNGDSANKIGTYSLAVLANAHQIPFYIAAPSSTIDPTTLSGKHIPIEERHPDEVRRVRKEAIAPNDVNCYNPAFDVTPAKLISAIITELGIYTEKFKAHFARN